MTDVLVTGLPRSGLTTLAALIDGLPGAVCLNAPEWQTSRARKLPDVLPYCKWLAGDFLWTRAQLLRGTPVHDYRAADGSPLLDGMHDPRQPKTATGEADIVFLTRPDLKEDFILGMKQHALYTALLPELIGFNHFKVIAVIRNPLDTIASWQRLNGHPLSQGFLPEIAPFWPEAAAIFESEPDPLSRMVQLYELFCQRYFELREHIDIIKYEDMMQDPMIVSKRLGADAASSSAEMIGELPQARTRDNAAAILDRLRSNSLYTKEFYILG